MTNPTPHGQVPEALIDLIDAYAETRHRCGGVYNAKTEAARKAVIEDLREALSGVQALSAAPATPPAEQPIGEVVVTKTRDGQIVAVTRQDDEGRILSVIATSDPEEQQAAPKAAPVKACVCGEPQSSGTVHRVNGPCYVAAPQQEPATAPRFNCWSTNEGDSWFDHPADAQAIYDCLGNDAKVGDEYELIAGWKSVTARYRITEVVGDGEEYEVECVSHPRENTAPQQEAQEPATVPYQKLTDEIDLILSDPDTELSIGAKRALLWMRTWVSVPLYTAPNPAPAPLSESEYKRGYRDGYDRRDAEVQGALV